MFKNMTVGKRIGLGFSLVVLIAVSLGGLGVWNMLETKTASTKLADEYVPEVKVATDLRGAANRAMYQMRGYGLTEEAKYYEAAKKEVESLNQHLTEAEQLAARAVYLKALKGQIETAKAAKDEYEGLMTQTEAAVAAMARERHKLDTSAVAFMKSSAEFLAGQDKAFNKDLNERQKKVSLVSEISNLGTKVRVTNFKAQASNDMTLMKQAATLLSGLGQYTNALRPITKVPADIKLIDDTEAAAQKYGALITSYIKIENELAAAGQKMNTAAAAYMKECNGFLAGQNTKMQKEFSQDGANLKERLEKITLLNNIIDLGNAARVENFKAQAAKDPKLMQHAMIIIAGVDKEIVSLRKITREAADIKRIANTESAAKAYLDAMKGYHKGFVSLGAIRRNMDTAAGEYVALCDTFLKGQQEKLATDMHERHAKISLANDIIDLGNDARVKAFKSQATRSPAVMQSAMENFPKLNEKYTALRKITRLDADLKRIDTTKVSGEQYAAALSVFLKEWTVLQNLGSERNRVGKLVIDACAATANAGITNTDQIATESAASLAANSTIMIVGLSIGAVLAIVAALWITRSIIGMLTRVIQGLNSGAEQTSSASGQVSSASQSLAQGASEQAASVEEVTSSIEEMASMTKQNATNADEAKSLAANATAGTARGTEAMGRMSTAIEDIKKSSDETAKIIKTIDEIAFQTNLLALNAAVEAARAGEAGKGFAVVAEEVRNLAQRSAEAARNTAEMIEESVKNADNGVAISKEVASLLGEISENNGKVNDLVGEIAAASNEQAQGIDQINTAVGQMDQVTQSNAANAEESASASEELSAQAENLSGMVGQLQTMVGGANGGEASKAEFRADNAKVATHQTSHQGHQAGNAQPKRANAMVASSNEDIIPMDDADLGSF
jgi:methyl-accepting chemotaxis protein